MTASRANRKTAKNAPPTAGSLLGEWVRRTRQLQGMSQRALADSSGLSRSYVCDIERGRGSEPSLATLDKLSAALGTTRAELMQAAGLIDKALVPRETDDERRLLAVYRDMSDQGQAHLLRYARFMHQEEHAWKQSSMLDDEAATAPARRPSSGTTLTLFDMDNPGRA